MAGPLQGVNVVELAVWVAGPSVAGVLADWGAQVIKIESPDGDPSRAWTSDKNPAFELDNRGKRSVTLDLKTAAGLQIAHELISSADVLVTNVRMRALESLGLDYAALADRYPRLVYASISGYGLEGPDRDRAAFDAGAFWSRTGAFASMTVPGAGLPAPPGGSGDHVTAISAVAGVTAALVARQATGRGQHVTTSLLRAGAFMLGFDVNMALRRGARVVPPVRTHVPNPLYNSYRVKDDRWLFLLGLQPDRHWLPVVRAVGLWGLVDDERFTTAEARGRNCADLIQLLDVAFATRSLADWTPLLDAEGVVWAPVQTAFDLLSDPQAEASGAFVDVPVAEGTARMVASSVDFLGTPWAVDRRTPEAGEHTEEVLLELGHDWDSIGELRSQGAFG